MHFCNYNFFFTHGIDNILCIKPPFVIIATCLPLDAVARGSIGYSTDSIDGEYPEGTTAIVTCEFGYRPAAQPSAICQPTREWTNTLECIGDR